ncbi:MAG: MurR/RpiR family transcriptional regulator [Rhodobacteraceae bacterium]|nr:MurR/RpiR family transcriptional regulator [Paracoccaceae bacterium]
MKPEFHPDKSDPLFLERVHQVLPSLHPAERRLAEFLLDFPGELASYDAQELAKLCDVSKATVSRFIRRLGFDTYDSARKAVREESKTGSRLFFGHAEPQVSAAALDLGLEEERSNLDWTFQRIETQQLDALAEALLGARKVWIVGYRISNSFATYLYWQLTKVLRDVVVCPRDGETIGEYIVGMEPDDVVIHIALRRRMAGTEVLLNTLQETGAKQAFVTDEGMPPQTQCAWHFRCRTQTSSPQFNHAAVLSLCHQIVIRATLQSAHEGRERLRKIDEINERLSLYD